MTAYYNLGAFLGQYYPPFGNGSDGEVILGSGSVTLKSIYEDDDVSGVTTWRGTDKGLNHGTDSYLPYRNKTFGNCRNVPNFTNFTINNGATLTIDALGEGTDLNNGVAWFCCTGTCTNSGAIDLAAKGWIGAPWTWGDSENGRGPGGGINGRGGSNPPPYGGTGGPIYGSTNIPKKPWENLFGSGASAGGGAVYDDSWYGGGGAGAGHRSVGEDGSDGLAKTPQTAGPSSGIPGNGGGALRIYAVNFNTESGTISVNGQNAVNGHAGGGSGGTVYIKTLNGKLGTNKITSTGGIGLTDWASSVGGDGSEGRIHIDGPYTGSTTTPPIE